MEVDLFARDLLFEQIMEDYCNRLTARFGHKLVWDTKYRRLVGWRNVLIEEARDRPSYLPRDMGRLLLNCKRIAVDWLHGGFHDVRYRFPEAINIEPCRYADHKWALEIHEGSVSVMCVDPCPEEKQIVGIVENGAYQASVCLEGIGDYHELVEMDAAIPIRLDFWVERGGYWDSSDVDCGLVIHPIGICECEECRESHKEVR